MGFEPSLLGQKSTVPPLYPQTAYWIFWTSFLTDKFDESLKPLIIEMVWIQQFSFKKNYLAALKWSLIHGSVFYRATINCGINFFLS